MIVNTLTQCEIKQQMQHEIKWNLKGENENRKRIIKMILSK